MDCDRVRDRIPEYICQALEGEDLSVVEAHLRECPECRRELENFKKLDAQLQEVVPALWEEIEPSPQFMAQLKRMKLDPQPESRPGIVDFLSGLWANHRMALATGLSICLIIVVMIAINPSFGSDDDDDESTEIAARYTTLSPASGATSQSVTVPEADATGDEPLFSLKSSDAAVGPAGPKGDSGETDIAGGGFATPSATTPPTEEMPTPTPSVEEFSIAEGLTPEKITEMAEKIALDNPTVKDYLAGEEPLSTSVAGAGTGSCNGPLVVIERAQAMSEERFILACVNLENQTVENIILSHYPPPDELPEPPLNTTPEPNPKN